MALKRRESVIPPKASNWNITPIVDGDTLKYKACMAGQYTITHVIEKGKRNPLQSFRYKKELDEFMELNGFVEGEQVRFKYEEFVEPLKNILHTVKTILNSLHEHFGKPPIIFLSGALNYRNQVAKAVPYKGNRWTLEKRGEAFRRGEHLYWLGKTEKTATDPIRPVHGDAVVEYLLANYDTRITFGMEADDALGIYQCANLEDCIMIKEDKDLDMIPGWKFNPYKEDSKTYKVEELEGLKFFYTQLLTGDTTDNILGLPGVGPSTASKILDGCENEIDMCFAVFNAYQLHYSADEEALGRMIENGQLLWIMRERGRVWLPPIL